MFFISLLLKTDAFENNFKTEQDENKLNQRCKFTGQTVKYDGVFHPLSGKCEHTVVLQGFLYETGVL